MPDGRRPGWWSRVYAFLFRFLGPAQLGSDHEPGTGIPDPGFACPACGQPMSTHSWVEDAGRRRMYCPALPLHD